MCTQEHQNSALSSDTTQRCPQSVTVQNTREHLSCIKQSVAGCRSATVQPQTGSAQTISSDDETLVKTVATDTTNSSACSQISPTRGRYRVPRHGQSNAPTPRNHTADKAIELNTVNFMFSINL